MTKQQERVVKANIRRNPSAKFIHDKIIAHADEVIKHPPADRKMLGCRLDIGLATEKVIILAYAYRMTGDKKYLNSAIDQMLTSAAYKDWNPSHFLCAAGMMTSMAIGYDWLYDDIPLDSRKIIEDALYKKGLAQGARRTFAHTYNWNSVCNGATIYAAIALFDLYPDVAKSAIVKSVKNNELCFPQYAPNGNYREGVIVDNSYLQITDTIQANKEVDLRWNMVTEAKAKVIDSTSILLEKDYDIDEYTLVGFAMKAPANKPLKFVTTLTPVK